MDYNNRGFFVPESAQYRLTTFNKIPRIKFNPDIPQHRLIATEFFERNVWSEGCPFLLEEPFVDIPSMLRDRLAKYYSANDKKMNKLRTNGKKD